MTSVSALANIEPGHRLGSFTTSPVTGLTLALFAGGSGDHNPIHVDPVIARENGFSDVIAHGMLSMAYLGRLLTNWVPPQQLRSFNVRFAAVTPIYSHVTCQGTVVEVTEAAGERRARIEVTTSLPDGTITLTGEALVALT